MKAGAAEVLFDLWGQGTGSLLGFSATNKEVKPQLAACTILPGGERSCSTALKQLRTAAR